MEHELEIEFKNMLIEAEYTSLLHYFFQENSQPVSQRNTYFDTKTFYLKEHLCAFRIREKDHSAEMTLKTPVDGHHNEYTIPLDNSEAEALIKQGVFELPDQLITALKEEGIMIDEPVQKIAQLKTLRYEKKVKTGLIVLDKSWYNDTVDYELEVEAATVESGEQLMTDLLSQFDIPKRPAEKKITRAFSGNLNH